MRASVILAILSALALGYPTLPGQPSSSASPQNVWGGGATLPGFPIGNGTAAAPGCPSCLTGIEAYWSFNNQSDGGVADLTGNGHDATALVNMGRDAGIVEAAIWPYTPASFPVNLNVVALSTLTGAWSTSSWVLIESNALNGGYACIACESSGEGLFAHSTKFSFYASGADHDTTSTWVAGAWTHVVVNYSGTAATFWINGVQDATHVFSLTAPGFGLTSLACVGNGYPMSGLLDETAIYSRELTPVEIGLLYNGGTPLVYPF